MKATEVIQHLVMAIAKRGDHEVYSGSNRATAIETYDAGTVDNEIPVTTLK